MRVQFRVSHIFHLCLQEEFTSHSAHSVCASNFVCRAQLNVWNKNKEESSHDSLFFGLFILWFVALCNFAFAFGLTRIAFPLHLSRSFHFFFLSLWRPITIQCSAKCRDFESSNIIFVVSLLRFHVFFSLVCMCECHYTNLMNELRSHSISNVLFHVLLYFWYGSLPHYSPKMIYSKTMFLSFSMFVSVFCVLFCSVSQTLFFSFFHSLCFLVLFSTVDCKLCEYSQWMDLHVQNVKLTMQRKKEKWIDVHSFEFLLLLNNE